MYRPSASIRKCTVRTNNCRKYQTCWNIDWVYGQESIMLYILYMHMHINFNFDDGDQKQLIKTVENKISTQKQKQKMKLTGWAVDRFRVSNICDCDLQIYEHTSNGKRRMLCASPHSFQEHHTLDQRSSPWWSCGFSKVRSGFSNPTPALSSQSNKLGTWH